MTTRATDNSEITGFSFIKLIKKFSKSEMNEFSKFLRSPFHNNHKTIVRLFCELRKFHPEYNSERLTKKYLFQVAGRSVVYNDSVFRKYMSRLFKLAEEYLSLIEFTNNQDVVRQSLLNQYSKRDAKELYSKKFHEIEKCLDTAQAFDFKRCYFRHKVKETNYSWNLRNFNYNNYASDIYASHNNLMNYFLYNAVSNYNQLLVDRSSRSAENEKNPIELFFANFDINKYLAELKEQNLNLFHDHLLSVELLTDDLKLNSNENGRDAYERFKISVNAMPVNMTKQIQHYLFKRLAIYCMTNFHNDEESFAADLYEHFRQMLERNLFTTRNKSIMNLLDYRAILNSALLVKKIAWAEKFLHDYIDLIREESRENLLNYGMANICFARGEFENCMEKISRLKIESYVLNLDIYILKSQVLYELGFIDSAKDLAETFRHHVSSNLVYSQELKLRLNSFIRFYMKLIRASRHLNKRIISSLRDELNRDRKSLKLKWLSEKTELIWKQVEER